MAERKDKHGEGLEHFEGSAGEDAEGQQPGEAPGVCRQGGDDGFFARPQGGERDGAPQ